MNINWYPGHMKKTRESIQENLKKVDVVYELIDARIPISSRNPIIDEILGEKPRVVVFNKVDLADANKTKLWRDYYKNLGIDSVELNSQEGKGIDKLIEISYKVTEEKRENYEKRGVLNRPIRAMIVGVPNVGKSTLINALSNRRGARVGNRPGVTKSNQWIKTGKNLDLLDTPGILWPKFEDQEVGRNLAFTGAIKDEILDRETLALRLIEKLMLVAPKDLKNRYSLENLDLTGLELMEEIGLKRGCVLRGNMTDYTKVSNIILDEFRKGIIGNITLEIPEVGE